MNTVKKGCFWLLLTIFSAGLANAQLPVIAEQDFEAYGTLGIVGVPTTMADGWVRYKSSVIDNNVQPEDRTSKVGFLIPQASNELRYWASPVLSGSAGTLTFDTASYMSKATETNDLNCVVFLADTNNRPSGYVVLTNITVAAGSVWKSHVVVIDDYDYEGKYLIIGRDKGDVTESRLLLDNIVLRAAPSIVVPTSLGLEGGGTTRLANQTLSPVLAVDVLGSVSGEVATLWYRYSGLAYWNQAIMTRDGDNFVLTTPIPAGNHSNRQFEMYATVSYTAELGNATATYPPGGEDAPVLIDILPVSGNAPMEIKGALPTQLALTTNQMWRGGMERESKVAGATYWFASPSETWGRSDAPQIPLRTAPESGKTLPAPAGALESDILFGFNETIPTQILVEYGLFQSFENWGETSLHGWSLNGDTEVVEEAPSVSTGAASLLLSGGASSNIESPVQAGIGGVEFWFRRVSGGTNLVNVTLEKRVGANWETVRVFAGRSTDQFIYASAKLNDPAAEAVRISADAPAYIDNIGIGNLSRMDLVDVAVTPDPVVATQTAMLTVDALVANGAKVIEPDGVQLYIRYGTSGAFDSPITLSLSGKTGDIYHYSTRENAPVRAPADASKVLQYYVTAQYQTWDNVMMPIASTPTNSVEVVPFSDWGSGGLNVVGDLAAPMYLIDNQLWYGAVLTSEAVEEPSFRFEDKNSQWWGDASADEIPALGTAVSGSNFSFSFDVEGGLAFTFDEETGEYIIQQADYESFADGELHGWTVTSFNLATDGGLDDGGSATSTAANAVIESPERVDGGVGDVSFWARMNDPAASATYTVEKQGASGWTVIGSGTVEGPFYSHYWTGVSDPLATRVRITFSGAGVAVDHVVASYAGAYVAISNPTWKAGGSTLTADVGEVPEVSYGGRPELGVTVTGFNGAANISVMVGYTDDSNPSITNFMAMAGNPAGGVFTASLPAMGVGITRYWYVAEYEGISASPILYPETGYFRYSTSGELGVNREPDFVAWMNLLGNNVELLRATIDGWLNENVFLQDGTILFSGAPSVTKLLRSPSLDGVGTIYFKSKPTLADSEIHKISVELASNANGPWTQLKEVEVAVTEDWNFYQIMVNSYGSPRYVRLVRTTTPTNPENRLAIKDVVITPPPADVVVAEPSIIQPGYPTDDSPITLYSRVMAKPGSESYPASDFRPTLVWRSGTNDWQYTAMTNTAVSGNYAITLPPQEANKLDYYYKVDFSGSSYVYVDGTNVFDEGKSPAYLGWDQSAFTNNVQTSRIQPDFIRSFEVRKFKSNHSSIILERDDDDTVTTMMLVDDHVWQAVILLTNAVHMGISLVGNDLYEPGAIAYGLPESWGDDDQLTINPPLSGLAEKSSPTDIVVDIDYDGFVMLRFNVTNGLYQVRRAAFQDFNTWQSDLIYFEESLGLHAIQNFVTDFNHLSQSHPTGIVNENFDLASQNPYNPPYGPVAYINDWRLENAWVTADRMAARSFPAAETPYPNQAVRLHGGAGTLQTTPQLHTRGRDTLDFSHRIAFGDDNLPYLRSGFSQKNYQYSAKVQVGQISPGNPTVSLIGYYYDRDNYYELRLTQQKNLTYNNNVGREQVVAQVYRKLNGISTAVGATHTINNSIGGKQSSLSLTLNSSGSTVALNAFVEVGGTTNQWTYTDSGVGTLAAGGGTISMNATDCAATFSNFQVVGWTGGFDYSLPEYWYLGGVPAGGTGTRWTMASMSLTRVVPEVPFNVRIVRVGEETSLNDQPEWVTVGSGTSTALSYQTFSLPLKTWDNTFIQIAPAYSDGMLVVDNISTRDWRGLTITDPEELPPGDPLGREAWRADEAYITPRGGSHQLELSRSRANPASMQMLTSPVLEDGIGTIAFVYEVSGGAVDFVVECNAYDGMVEPEDVWRTIETVSLGSGGSGSFHTTARTNMVGRVRVRLLNSSDDNATLWLDNLFVTDYPSDDGKSWKAYNALITTYQPDRSFEPGISEHRTAYLNNHPENGVRADQILGDDKPYIQSPQIETGIGEIGFWVRAWDPTAEFPGQLKLMVAESSSSTNWTELTLVNPDSGEVLPEDAIYKQRLSSITNATYEYFTIETFDKDNRVLRIYAETNNASRVALDNIIVTEPVRSSIDILNVSMTPDIPLAGEPVGVNIELGNPRMDPYNIQVYLDYYLGSNIWGVANWGTDPALYKRIRLEQSYDDPYMYHTTSATEIPAQDIDDVVQYRIVVTYSGTFASPIEYSSFTNPEWYEPVDLNVTYQDQGFSPYYFVFSCPTGSVFFSEFFNAQNATHYNREFIEMMGAYNTPIGNWKVDIVDASFSTDEDYVRSTYEIPVGARLGGGTNGWGFYVLGDNDPSIIDYVDYVFPDGGNPDALDPASAFLPSSGGFRLRRSMGAYVDRISYGPSSIADHEMADRGYKFTVRRAPIGTAANRSIGLGIDSLTGVDVNWQTYEDGSGISPGRMNSFELQDHLGEIDPFEDSDLPGAAAALSLAIVDLQLQSGYYMIHASAVSTNEITDLTGWTGILQTNATPGVVGGWGDTTVNLQFSIEGEYVFPYPAGDDLMLFRIRATSSDAP